MRTKGRWTLETFLNDPKSVYYRGPDKRAASQDRADVVSCGWVPGPDEFRLRIIPPTIAILDLDFEPGSEEAERWEAIEADNPTAWIKTPNGRHLYYRLPARFHLPGVVGLGQPEFSLTGTSGGDGRDPVIGRSVDLLTGRTGETRAYVVLPPTKGYEVKRGGLMAFLPMSVIQMVYRAACEWSGGGYEK